MAEYRTLAERIVRSACCASQFDIDHAERLIAAHFAERDAVSRRLVELGWYVSGQAASNLHPWPQFRIALKALAALLPEQEEPR